MRFFPASIALILMCCSPVQSQQVSPHAQKIAELTRELRAIGTPAANKLYTGPPAQVPALLRQLNQELKSLIIEDLNNPDPHFVTSESVIREQLGAAGWEEVPDHRWNAYGEIMQIRFDSRVERDSRVLAVSTQLWLPCGGESDPDTSIYVFTGSDRHWELVLSTDADFASQNSDMMYGISPIDSQGRWFLVVAQIPPTCRGLTTIFRYKALRPGSSPEKPIVLLNARTEIDEQFDPTFRLSLQDDWFGVIYGDKRKLDGEVATPIHRFRVVGDQIQRIAPLALTPEDFLDQWVQLAWGDAKKWSAATAGTEIEKWHSVLSGLADDSAELSSVHKCSETREVDQVWKIELWVDRQLNPSIKGENLYIEIEKRNGIFSVDGVSDKRAAGCEGKTSLVPRTNWELPGW